MPVRERRILTLIATIGALTALCFPTAALAEPAALAPFELKVNGSFQGEIVATIEDAAAGETQSNFRCQERCSASYRVGRVVTLTAKPEDPSEFGFWSDDRCPPGPVCKLKVDSGKQTVVASFSPQLLVVDVANETSADARVTSQPAGSSPLEAPFAACGISLWCREFPVSKESEITLTAHGDAPFWGVGDEGDACDVVDGAKCVLLPYSERHVALRFGGPPVVLPGEPGEVRVTFRVAKDGTGVGTVRSPLFDCGENCKATLDFGERHTVVADAARGSHFVRWRGACGTSPRCTLAAGPVTRITAVFDAEEAPSENKPSGTDPQRPKRRPGSKAAFTARVGRVVVRGARPRRLRFTVGVNAPSSIQALLENGRGRSVTSRTWRVQAGTRVLRLSVPRRTPGGNYVLRITVRDRAGNVKRFNRRVRLRR